VTVAGLTYDGNSYDSQEVDLDTVEYSENGCSCVLSGTASMHVTGSGDPGTNHDLAIRVELHDNCIMYAEATLAVSGSPIWSGRCGDTLNCTDGLFFCGIPGLGGMISLQSWTVFGNSFNLVIDGDCCPVDCLDCWGAPSITLTISGVASAPCDLRHPPMEDFCGDPAQINGVWVLPYTSGGKFRKVFNINCGEPCPTRPGCAVVMEVYCWYSGFWQVYAGGDFSPYLAVVERYAFVKMCCQSGAPYGGGVFTYGYTCSVAGPIDGSFTVSP
jgi:hypothetical protein